MTTTVLALVKWIPHKMITVQFEGG